MYLDSYGFFNVFLISNRTEEAYRTYLYGYALSIYRGKPNIKRHAPRVNLFHCHTYSVTQSPLASPPHPPLSASSAGTHTEPIMIVWEPSLSLLLSSTLYHYLFKNNYNNREKSYVYRILRGSWPRARGCAPWQAPYHSQPAAPCSSISKI
jgi:hypothetical protein